MKFLKFKKSILKQEAQDVNNLKVTKNNKFIGVTPKLENSRIIFSGDNNILICEKDVVLKDSKLEFNGDNSTIYLSSNKNIYKLNVSINNNSTFFIGKNNYINGIMTLVISEGKNIFIGSDGVFSFGIWFRTADPHLIYSIETNKRINDSKSIYIGDHVWIGQNVLLLKGTQIDSGSIIGANSVVSNKIINNNEIWAGNPVTYIKNDIFWDGRCVHRWLEKDTLLSQNYEDLVGINNVDNYIFKYDSKQYLSYGKIEKILNSISGEEKYNYLKKISEKSDKNRFVRRKHEKK